jgi:hypothetical protein
MSTDTTPFHKNAKDAGNRLAAFVTNFAAGAVAVFFLALTQTTLRFNPLEKITLILALVAFGITAFLRLYELHIDAKRFFEIAKQHALDGKPEQDWTFHEHLKSLRLSTIWWSYTTFVVGVLASFAFMLSRVAG